MLGLGRGKTFAERFCLDPTIARDIHYGSMFPQLPQPQAFEPESSKGPIRPLVSAGQ
jgi:hypothetical protein